MENVHTMLDLVVERYSSPGIELTRVPTARGHVYTDGALYIKTGQREIAELEAAIWQVVNPGKCLGTVSVADLTALITERVGVSVGEQDFTAQQCSRWLAELQRMHGLTVPPGVSKLDIAREIQVIYGRLSGLPPAMSGEIQPHVERLLTTWSSSLENVHHVLLHGDPNFRNVVFNDDAAHLIDFDHATIGPIEWDLANVRMVCLVAGRHDLYEQAREELVEVNDELLAQLTRIRLAQSIVHAAAHPAFETPAGLTRRPQRVATLLLLNSK